MFMVWQIDASKGKYIQIEIDKLLTEHHKKQTILEHTKKKAIHWIAFFEIPKRNFQV